MTVDKVQIPMDPQADLPRGQAAYRFLEPLRGEADDRWMNRVREYLNAALPNYPELVGKTITVGRMDPDHPKAHAQADHWNDMVVFQVEQVPPVDTVFHELTHLAIYELDAQGEDVPVTSEPYCSILSTSRISGEWIQRDDIAYLGTPTIPKREWPGVCERALEYRERHRDYIAKCKEWLKVEDEQPRTLWEM